MTCEQIRESVDAVNVSETATLHLRACTPCRKETASAAKLVALLNAQPQVKAPADFMARLQMRLATETVNEDARLKSLLQSVPAISAPPDFAFRVRARLAQEKAQDTVSNPLVWLQNWFTQSFSFGQAATAMAAIALIAVFTTVQLRQSIAPASTEEAPAGAMVAKANITAGLVEETVVSPAAKVSVRNVRASAASVAPKAFVATPAKLEIARTAPTESAEPAMYSPKTKQVFRHGQAYFGQELAKVVASSKAESMVAAF